MRLCPEIMTLIWALLFDCLIKRNSREDWYSVPRLYSPSLDAWI